MSFSVSLTISIIATTLPPPPLLLLQAPGKNKPAFKALWELRRESGDGNGWSWRKPPSFDPRADNIGDGGGEDDAPPLPAATPVADLAGADGVAADPLHGLEGEGMSGDRLDDPVAPDAMAAPPSAPVTPDGSDDEGLGIGGPAGMDGSGSGGAPVAEGVEIDEGANGTAAEGAGPAADNDVDGGLMADGADGDGGADGAAGRAPEPSKAETDAALLMVRETDPDVGRNGRIKAAAACLDGLLLTYGGEEGSDFCGTFEAWTLPEGRAMAPVKTSGGEPDARRRAGACVVPMPDDGAGHADGKKGGKAKKKGQAAGGVSGPGLVVLFGGESILENGTVVALDELVLLRPEPHAVGRGGKIATPSFRCDIAPATTGPAPCPRANPLVTRFGPDDTSQVLVAGGFDSAGAPLFDAYILDVTTMTWTVALEASSSQLPDKPYFCLLRDTDTLVVLGTAEGGTKLSVALTFDLIGAAAAWDLKKVLKKEIVERVEAAERWVEKQGATMDMAANKEALSESKEKQTKVAEALFEIERKREAAELELDSLQAIASLLRKMRSPMAREEKEIEELQERFADVKKDAAGPVAKDFEPFRIRLAEELKTKYKDFERGELRDFQKSFASDVFFQAGKLDEAYPAMQERRAGLTAMTRELDALRTDAGLFQMPELTDSGVALIGKLSSQLLAIKNVWDVTDMVGTQLKAWRAVAWTSVNVEEMEDGVKALEKELRALDKSIKDEPAYKALQSDLKNMSVSVPLVADLRHPAMRDRHWTQLMDATKIQFVIDAGFKLGDLLALELHKFEEDVGEIVDQAQKEEKMETNLRKLDETWAAADLEFTPFKDSGVDLARMKDEDFELLEEHQVLVQGMMANRYMATFKESILGWNAKLMAVYDVNAILAEIQRSWSHLESLFIHSEEVKKELPDTTKRFAGIDVGVRKILKTMLQMRNAVAFCTRDGLMAELESLQSELELCDKALSDYMESKRRAFPRFYFVSRNDLLDILSNGNNPVKVMKHMSKCFQAIAKLILDNDDPAQGAKRRPEGQGIVSCVGTETLQWTSPLKLNGKVEEYMTDIIAKMRSELRETLALSVKDYPARQRHEWLLDWPSQLILVVSQIFWCQETEEALAAVNRGDARALSTYNQKQTEQLNKLIEVTKTNLDKPSRQKVMNMITIDAHSRDIVGKMVEEGCDRTDAFLWTIQLRTYWDKAVEDCRIRICDAFFPYGYEYLGNGPRLVITPLTDRIYITATQACWLSMGTAPAGPAGTGKTETTKDLSAQLGKSIYVFNCGPEMDYRTMGDIFKGLAASGSWGCFDEFNRLVPSVLSVCSVQYKCVCDSQRKKANLPGRGLEYIDQDGVKHAAVEGWTFVAADGVTMPLEEGTSGFITMNPGYIGRAELPESLKVLFRPITVVVPDRQLIMENMLMAEGFTEAKVLAKKFASLYFLNEDLLSPQKHYDWGLRAIKSVLVVAGSLLRAKEGQVEQDVLYRALRDFNVPKILNQDMDIFMGLLQDLFPGVDPPRKRDAAFEAVITAEAEKANLCVDDDFLLRVTQFADLLAIRHCVFLMGPTGTARTEVYRTLAKAIMTGTDKPENDYLQMCNRKKVYIKDINPKSQPTTELYGFVNMATREWKDGILSKTMRDFQDAPGDDPKWMILDGDLDANWIESMNSVMDDNRLLTLPSNERIRVLDHMKLIFEIRDLKFATPATATRAGILYISEATQWRNVVNSWITSTLRPFLVKQKFADVDDLVSKISYSFEKNLPDAIFEMKARYSHVTPLNTMNFITTLINVFEGMLDPVALSSKADPKVFEMILVFSMVWAFGGGLIAKDGVDYRRNFDRWFKGKYTAVKFPSKGQVFDFYVDLSKAKLASWGDLVSETPFDSKTQAMGSVFVPTPETASASFFLDMMVRLRKPVMFVGGAGVGKTQLVRGNLERLDAETHSSLTLTFNYFSEVSATQRIMEGPLEKAGGINYAPPGQRQLVYFVDDMNMPKLDAYETAMPISLMRQHLGWGHWFDRAKLTPKNILNTQYVACMNPTAGAFVVNPRLQRLFMTLAMDFPSQESLMSIYGTFLRGHLQHFSEPVKDLEVRLLQAALQLHEKVSTSFRKTAINFHYEFTVRHLATVFQGLLQSTPEGYDSPGKFVKLWLHESERVYSDRLVSYAHLATYQKAAEGAVKKFDTEDLSDYFRSKDPKPLIFCPFANGVGEKDYDVVPSLQALSKILVEALAEYNETNPVMDLVLFDDALRHVSRIARIISNPSGHALLVGVGGMGKQSLARLSAYVCGLATEMVVISGTYGINNFKEDLQRMYRKSGVKGEGVCFLFTDSQIVDERMLVFLNDLLASGEIPDLFAAEDKDEIINQMRSETKSRGLVDTNENCWSVFIDRVKENLHVCLTHSPVGENFRIRAQRFPAIINSTVIDWFQPWPATSLHSVAKKFIDDVQLDSKEIRDAIVDFMPESFTEVNALSEEFLRREKRFNYTTPKSFLELIKLYKNMLGQKRSERRAAIERLEVGLSKLNKTKDEVDVLIEEAKIKAVEVEQKVKSADIVSEQVGTEKEKAAKENAIAQVEAEKCAVIQKDVSAKQAQAEVELAKAEPALLEAQAALDTLNAKDLQTMKAFNKPPVGVDDVTNVVLILTEGDPKLARDGWANAKKILFSIPANQLIDRLKGFKDRIDAGEISKKTVDACRPYQELEWFSPEYDMSKKAAAAASLKAWANAIIMYYDVVSQVEPLRQSLAEASEQLEAANTKLHEVETKVAELNALVADLEKQFVTANNEKEAAEKEKARCDLKLSLANRLINALSSEGERWAETVVELKSSYKVLVGDMLLASAFVSYAGPFTSIYRDRLIKGWVKFLKDRGVPCTEGLKDPLAVLVDDATVAGWVSEGLPSDPTSVQNGAILTTSERWPLMMDPQLQGVAWIKERASKANLTVIRMGQPKMINAFERAIEAGHSVLIENMAETIDAVLNPVITRSTFKKGRSMYVKLGDKEVEYHKEFKLYLHTKLGNPHYPPEVQAETTLINFTVTEQGLNDQLLALVVNKERPELESTKTELLVQSNEFIIRLKEIEDGLLQKLSDAEGDITEDVELIESLEESKRVAEDIQEKVEIGKVTEELINESREKYRPVSERGAMLFFLLNSLNKVHAFYQFSLNAFVTVFSRGIDRTAWPGDESGGTALAPARARFMYEARRIIAEKSFDWNKDLIHEMSGQNRIAALSRQHSESGSRVEEAKPVEIDLDALRAKELAPELLEARLEALLDTCTYTVFEFTRRGLFDRDKLIVAAMLALTVLRRSGSIAEDEYQALIEGKRTAQPAPISDELSQWMADLQWAGLDALGKVASCASLAKDMERNSDAWRRWCDLEACEKSPLPGDWGKHTTPFQQLLILRVLRPDRVTNAIHRFVEGQLGPRYTNQPAFKAETLISETSPSAPCFFVLFPGYSPSQDIEAVSEAFGMTRENGKLTIISLGQGQEKPAEETLDRYIAEGGWVFLDNLHLMQDWVPVFERKLEVAAESAHPDFRCFFSAEPINGAPHAKIVPESILQGSIKVSNEPPSDMKSNMRSAFAAFTPEDIDRLSTDRKKRDYRAILFALCFYHGVLLGRKKFGSGIGTSATGSGMGWCRSYSFNMGDLVTCANVLRNYIEGNDEVPWNDLRYMFGEVFYGGHIVDDMDRRTCNTYLEVLIQPTLIPTGQEPEDAASVEHLFAPGFKAPMPTSYASLAEYIETSLPDESPLMYGMHPNAQLSLLTSQGENLFRTILDVSGGSSGGSGSGNSEAKVRSGVEAFLALLPEPFVLIEIEQRIKESTPYTMVATQEAARMNNLIDEIRSSLEELQLGLDGALNMSERMEALADGIATNRVPARWMSAMSTRIQEVYNLSTWFEDVRKRHEQLKSWTNGNVVVPPSVWLPGLFNPKAFVTAVMQSYARRNKLPLDVMKYMTEVTTKSAGQVTEPAPEGNYVHGLVLEGARWDRETGALAESRPNDIHPTMPVILVRPVTTDDYDLTGFYSCPVYTNSQRANNYSPLAGVFTLRTNAPPSKWVLASVALLMQDELAG